VDGLIGLNGEVLDFANLPPQIAKTLVIEDLGTEAIEIASEDLMTWLELTPEEKDLLVNELGATEPIADALAKIREYNRLGIPQKVADIVANIDFGSILSGFVFPGFAQGGIVTQPTFALIGEGGADEVVIPLDDPKRAARLASASGLIGLLAQAASPVSSSGGGSAVASGQAAGRSGVEVVAVGGNTFQISGTTADEIMSKIETRERAQVRRRRRL
jgi:SLT domain-containing protein